METGDAPVDGARRLGWWSRRRLRVALIALATLCVGAAVLVAATGNDDVGVDASSDRAPARWLPSDPPLDLQLAWVDDHPDTPIPPRVQEWTWQEEPAYVYGFRPAVADGVAGSGAGPTQDTPEVTVRVYPGWSLPAASVAESLEHGFRAEGSSTDVDVRTDRAGRAAVTFEEFGRVVAFELDGVVFHVAATGPDGTVPTFDELDAFVHSFRALGESTWREEVATADVAPPYGARDPRVTLLEGATWRLDRYGYRPRLRAGMVVADLIVDGVTPITNPAEPDYGMYGVESDLAPLSFLQIELVDVPGGVVAWGLSPPEVATIRFTHGDMATEVATLPFSANRIFAVELPEPPSGATALASDGRELDVPAPLLDSAG